LSNISQNAHFSFSIFISFEKKGRFWSEDDKGGSKTNPRYKKKQNYSDWHIGIKYANSINELYSSETVKVINNDNSFFADPHIVHHKGSHYIFVEEFLYSNNKGIISLLELKNGNINYLGPIIQEDFHLSFPFIFSYDEFIYLVCEASIGHISIYKSKDFPVVWEKDDLIKLNERVTDPIILQSENNLILIYNKSLVGCRDFNHVSHSYIIDPKTKSLNQIRRQSIFDSTRSRNAGYFSIEGKYLLVKQKQGNDLYGESIQIFDFNPSSELSKSKPLHSIKGQDLSDEIKQIHTLSYDSGVFVFDYTNKG
jgi:hypothetical protein